MPWQWATLVKMLGNRYTLQNLSRTEFISLSVFYRSNVLAYYIEVPCLNHQLIPRIFVDVNVNDVKDPSRCFTKEDFSLWVCFTKL